MNLFYLRTVTLLISLIALVSGFSSLENEDFDSEELLLTSIKKVYKRASIDGSGDGPESESEKKCSQSGDEKNVIINCSNKEFTSLPKGLEQNSHTLLLDNNNISSLGSEFFYKMDKLRNLKLQKNSISSIESNAFENLPDLETIDLGGNKINKLNPKTFQNLTKLTELFLNDNPISIEENVSFLESQSLKTLNLSNCSLKNLPPRAFKDIINLQELNLDKNNLDNKAISKESFEGLIHLKKLILQNRLNDELRKEICSNHIALEICDQSCLKCEASKPGNEIFGPERKSAPSIPLEVKEVKDEDKQKQEKETKEKDKEPAENTNTSNENSKPETNEMSKNSTTKLDDTPIEPEINNGQPKENPIKPIDTANKPDNSDNPKKDDKENKDESPKLNNDPKSEDPTSVETKQDKDKPEDGKDEVKSKTIPSSDDSTSTSTAGVTTRGVNGPAIGIIVTIIIVMVAGIIIKKNWSTIKNKWSSSNNPRNANNRPTESVPLRTGNNESNPI